MSELKPMYQGMVNSPEMTLSNAMGGAVSNNVVHVTDLPSAFLDAEIPILLTIGIGEDAETVLVTELYIEQKYFVVERGFQGPIKSWPEGTPVARNFTEYDYEALRSNVATLGLDRESIASMLYAIATVIENSKNEDDKLVVQLSGSNVEIGSDTFQVSGGDTIRGKSSDKPIADAAHAAIPFCYYFSVDTGIVEVTDGTKWVVI